MKPKEHLNKIVKCYNCGFWRSTFAQKGTLCCICNKHISLRRAIVKLCPIETAVEEVQRLNTMIQKLR